MNEFPITLESLGELSQNEDEDHLFYLKKLVNAISEEIQGSKTEDPFPPLEDFMNDINLIQNFFHDYFIRENYIKILIEKINEILDKQKEKLIFKENEVSNLIQKSENLQIELQLSQSSLNQFQKMYNDLLDKFRILEETLFINEDKYENCIAELIVYKEQNQLFLKMKEKYEELKNIENVEIDCVIELKSENSRLKQNYQIIKQEFWNLKEENKNLENLNLSNIQKFEKVNNQALRFKSEKETIDIENQKLKELNLFLTEKYSELQKENENLKKKKNELNNASFISETIKKDDEVLIQKPKKRDSTKAQRTGSLFNEIYNMRRIDINESFNEDEIKFDDNFLRQSFESNISMIGKMDYKQKNHSKVNNSDLTIFDPSWNPLLDFFKLTSQSVKLNFKNFDDIVDFETLPLYYSFRKDNIPYHKWNDLILNFIEQEYEERKKKDIKPKIIKKKKKNKFFSFFI